MYKRQIILSVVVFLISLVPPSSPKPAPVPLTRGEEKKEVVYVRVQPTREQKMKDLEGELENALKALDGLSDDERTIAEDYIRMEHLKRVEKTLKC